MRIQYSYLVILLFIGLCHGVSHATTCTERGRFPNDENNDCRGYLMCLMGGITNFTQYKLTCPQGFIYSHLEQQCTNSTHYKCYPSFNCTSVGNFMNPDIEDCSSFVSCVQELSGMATARMIECPPNTLFNTTIGGCVDKNLTTCFKPVVQPVSIHPLDEPNNHNDVNDHNHQHTHHNNAVSNNINVVFLLFIGAILFIY